MTPRGRGKAVISKKNRCLVDTHLKIKTRVSHILDHIPLTTFTNPWILHSPSGTVHRRFIYFSPGEYKRGEPYSLDTKLALGWLQGVGISQNVAVATLELQKKGKDILAVNLVLLQWSLVSKKKATKILHCQWLSHWTDSYYQVFRW